MSWFDASMAWFEEQHTAHPDLSADELRKWCSKNYPYDERKGWAYKAWLKAAEQYFGQRARRGKQEALLLEEPV